MNSFFESYQNSMLDLGSASCFQLIPDGLIPCWVNHSNLESSQDHGQYIKEKISYESMISDIFYDDFKNYNQSWQLNENQLDLKVNITDDINSNISSPGNLSQIPELLDLSTLPDVDLGEINVDFDQLTDFLIENDQKFISDDSSSRNSNNFMTDKFLYEQDLLSLFENYSNSENQSNSLNNIFPIDQEAFEVDSFFNNPLTNISQTFPLETIKKSDSVDILKINVPLYAVQESTINVNDNFDIDIKELLIDDLESNCLKNQPRFTSAPEEGSNDSSYNSDNSIRNELINQKIVLLYSPNSYSSSDSYQNLSGMETDQIDSSSDLGLPTHDYADGRKVPSENKIIKKEQNKTAALKYRQKKSKEQRSFLTEYEETEKKNTQLKLKVDEITKEINYLRGLLNEINNVADDLNQ